MDKYDKLMIDIVAYLDVSVLGSFNPTYQTMPDRGPIAGCSEREIEEAEGKIGKKIPAAMKAWYRVAGKVSPYYYDYRADYTLDDLLRSQEAAQKLYERLKPDWELSDTLLPFSERLGESILFADLSENSDDDDPFVLHVRADSGNLESGDVIYSRMIREIWLGSLERVYQRQMRGTNWGKIPVWKAKGFPDYQSWERVERELTDEAWELRNELIERINQEDLASDKISGPQEVQQRWIAEITLTKMKERMESVGVWIPFNWIEAPK